jgi:hypothetical protein
LEEAGSRLHFTPCLIVFITSHPLGSSLSKIYIER